MAVIHVWPDKFSRAWDGSTDNIPKTHPVVPALEAIQNRYTTDAHFCPAYLPGVEVHPRLSVKARPDLISQVRFSVIVFDIDAPEHKGSDEWYRAQIIKLEGTPWDSAIRYQTKGGYRLVWELPHEMDTKEYLRTLEALRQELLKYDVKADRFIDWSRCYRLPFVRREGKNQNLDIYIPENPTFPIGFLTIQEEAPAKELFAEIAEARTGIGAVGTIDQTSRNNLLFRMMSGMRSHSWIDEELGLSIALTINAEKCNPPLPETEVEALVKNVWSRYQPEEHTENELDEVTDKAKIVIHSGKMDKAVSEIVEALTKHPNIFVRQAKLVRVIDGAMENLEVANLTIHALEVAEFFRLKATYNKETKSTDFEEIRVDPDVRLLEAVLKVGIYPGIRELLQVAVLPSLRPDGILISQRGYDAPTKALLLPDLSVDLPDDPTPIQVAEAFNHLHSLYENFPFVEPCHRSSAMASLMTPILRLAVEGPTPLFLMESPTPGSGKGLLAAMVSVLATGKAPVIMSPTDETEFRKEITSQLLLGTKVVTVDNVEKPIGGPSFDALLTSDWWAARDLGKIKMLVLKNGSTWIVTGNNVRLQGDLARRVIRVLIDPGMEDPESRDPSQYRYPELLLYIKENRAQIIRDVLLVARARHLSGIKFRTRAMGSFEAWSYWVRETLLYLGMADCLDSQAALKTGANVGTFGHLLSCGYAVFGGKDGETREFTAKEVWDVIFEGRQQQGSREELNGFIAAYSEMTDDKSLRGLSRLLERWSSRVVHGLKLTRDTGDDPIKGVQWKIVKKGEAGNAQTGTG